MQLLCCIFTTPRKTSEFNGFCHIFGKYFCAMMHPAETRDRSGELFSRVKYFLSFKNFLELCIGMCTSVWGQKQVSPCSWSLNFLVGSVWRNNTAAYAGYLMTYGNSCSVRAECDTPQQVKQNKPASLSPHHCI